MNLVIDVAKHATMITAFVFVMMLVIEYLNVQTSGGWQEHVARHRWGQYILAAALGAVPGCLGAFAVVAMYSHGALTVGAVVAAMVATSGDESFVMLAMIPRQALTITVALFALGVVAGAATDAVTRRGKSWQLPPCDGLELHVDERCTCFPRGQILHQWRKCAPHRGILAVALALFAAALVLGDVGPHQWNWIRVTLLVVSVVALFIVSTVPDHFLEEHLWHHVARKHIPRVFLWTLGALLAIHVLTDSLHLEGTIREGQWLVLLIACVLGVIPESGPHLVFVTLYVQGAVPLSVLLASSIVQDGHGMLPMLAHSGRAFLAIKAANLVVGLACGALAMAMGL